MIVASLSLVHTARAVTITWTGGGNNSWHTAANWDLAAFPKPVITS